MNRKEVIQQLKEYFDIRELVCPHTYGKFGENSWQFFDYQFLENLLILRRDVLKEPMIVNTYYQGGDITQRGFRCNICQLVRDKTLRKEIYLTAHANGAAIDSVFKSITAKDARMIIKARQKMFTMPVRVERDVSWLHFDIYDPMNGKKYNEF